MLNCDLGGLVAICCSWTVLEPFGWSIIDIRLDMDRMLVAWQREAVADDNVGNPSNSAQFNDGDIPSFSRQPIQDFKWKSNPI
jgi:hypothetical protein